MARCAETAAGAGIRSIRGMNVVKSGGFGCVFEKMQAEQIVRIKIEAFALDSTSIRCIRMDPAL